MLYAIARGGIVAQCLILGRMFNIMGNTVNLVLAPMTRGCAAPACDERITGNDGR